MSDIEVDKFFEDYFDDAASRRTRSSEVPEMPPIENTLTATPDLYDHLTWQLHMSVSDELLLEIGDAIIQNVDEDGMLRASVEEIANMGPYAMEEVEKALALVQNLDPDGVAARDLTECLRNQLKKLGLEGSPTDIMVRDHLKQLQAHQYPEISRQMGLTLDEVSHHLEVIQRLDPKPGMKHSPNRSTYVVPDVFVVKEGEEYRVVLNDDGLPRLRISPTYKRMMDAKEGNAEETRTAAREAAQRVVAPEERRPAPADDLQGHRVDRAPPARLPGPRDRAPAAAGAARRGQRHRHARVDGLAGGGQQVRAHAARGLRAALLLPQRDHVDDGRAVSSVTIKDRIRKMIDTEDQTRPLSDAQIAEILGQGGLPLARRTVAKYREELRIPPQSSQVRPPTLGGAPQGRFRSPRRWAVLIEYTGRQTEVPPALKKLAERKLRKLERVLGRITHVHVVLAADKHRLSAEVSVNSPHLTLSATDELGPGRLVGNGRGQADPAGAAASCAIASAGHPRRPRSGPASWPRATGRTAARA